ncbi:hypothetical protein [Microvirga pakistanensis]|uniref:hypothetical protein n=1 Tax=Microvirga pakistanensis TaxID=1682650 RepID=UPI0010699DFB|nr:hypothetical protein [Microvirga pakistanensis]
MTRRNRPKLLKPATGWLALPLIGLPLLGPGFAESLPAGRLDEPVSHGPSDVAESANDLSAALPFLITSFERRRLAAELLDSIEQGNLKGAEHSLNAAIETGTLAIALIDRLNDPNLLSSLKGLDLQDARRSNAARECPAPAAIPASNVAQLQEALDHEAAYSGMVTRTLTDLMGQYNALTARRDADASETLLKVSQLQNALQQEQQKREAIVSELATLQAEHHALQASAQSKDARTSSHVADLEALLQRERERSEDAERQLASAREEARNLLAFKDSQLENEAASAVRIAELEEALSQTRARSDDFAQKLAAATGALRLLQEANNRKPKPLISESVPVEAEDIAPPQEDIPASAKPASALPLGDGAPVEVAQLSGGALPLSASIAPAPAPVEVEAPPARDSKVIPAPPAIKPEDRLTARAEELLRKGDVSGARLLLERSLNSGNARAAFLLAETFDPHALTRLGALGIRGDADKARKLYEQAQALGMSQASERLQALK